jgi:hypothetical protein
MPVLAPSGTPPTTGDGRLIAATGSAAVTVSLPPRLLLTFPPPFSAALLWKRLFLTLLREYFSRSELL